MTAIERELLRTVARVLLSLCGWGSVSPTERAAVSQALQAFDNEAKP